jgi:RimJ/RimL family protein N-acetyltransferase
MPVTHTDRLRLLAPSLPDFAVFTDAGRTGLAARLGVTVPPDWPVFPESTQPPERLDETQPWRPYWAVHTADNTLICEGGLVPPDPNGEVIFGYGLVAAYRGRGLATEFASALVGLALADARVRAVGAFTFPAGAVSPEGHPADPSIALLRRLGFATVDEGEHWRWRLSRR